jgi:hypothetical protein
MNRPEPIITAVDEYLRAAYWREVVDRKPLTGTELAAMVKLLARSDIEARLQQLRGIPKERCFVSATFRDLLTRALAAL